MNKRYSKKLAVAKETLHRLNERELAGLVGGVASWASDCGFTCGDQSCLGYCTLNCSDICSVGCC